MPCGIEGEKWGRKNSPAGMMATRLHPKTQRSQTAVEKGRDPYPVLTADSTAVHLPCPLPPAAPLLRAVLLSDSRRICSSCLPLSFHEFFVDHPPQQAQLPMCDLCGARSPTTAHYDLSCLLGELTVNDACYVPVFCARPTPPQAVSSMNRGSARSSAIPSSSGLTGSSIAHWCSSVLSTARCGTKPRSNYLLKPCPEPRASRGNNAQHRTEPAKSARRGKHLLCSVRTLLVCVCVLRVYCT